MDLDKPFDRLEHKLQWKTCWDNKPYAAAEKVNLQSTAKLAKPMEDEISCLECHKASTQ